MELEKRILEILNNSGIHIFHSDFELTATGNVGGILTSDSFKGLDEVARQELVWEKLQTNLSEEELQHIVSLITVTPDEEKLFKQEA
jgi:acid stress-induced BolA-like protein IbaG/YrbA